MSVECDRLLGMSRQASGILFVTIGAALFVTAAIGKQVAFYGIGAAFIAIGAVYIRRAQMK